MIRVVLVDDQELVRAGFRMVLDAQPNIDVVDEAADGRAAVELLRATSADVVLMDVRMPRMDGIEATRQIVPLGPKVIILTTFDLDEYAFKAIKAGAAGFMLKDARPVQLIEAIRSVHSGDAVVAPSTTRRLLEQFAEHLPDGDDDDTAKEAAKSAATRLTEREMEVLLLVARGLSNAEIAKDLHVAEATVKTHVGRVLAKLGLRDRVQIVVYAYEVGLVRRGRD